MIGWQDYVYNPNEFLASAKTVILDERMMQGERGSKDWLRV